MKNELLYHSICQKNGLTYDKNNAVISIFADSYAEALHLGYTLGFEGKEPSDIHKEEIFKQFRNIENLKDEDKNHFEPLILEAFNNGLQQGKSVKSLDNTQAHNRIIKNMHKPENMIVLDYLTG